MEGNVTLRIHSLPIRSPGGRFNVTMSILVLLLEDEKKGKKGEGGVDVCSLEKDPLPVLRHLKKDREKMRNIIHIQLNITMADTERKFGVIEIFYQRRG